jgi:hypothetical protein
VSAAPFQDLARERTDDAFGAVFGALRGDSAAGTGIAAEHPDADARAEAQRLIDVIGHCS